MTSPMDPHEGLLACPFCGGEAKCNGHPGGTMGQIYCDGEECFGPRTTALTKQDSIVQWNTRAGDAQASTLPTLAECSEREAIRAVVRDMFIVHARPESLLRSSMGLGDELIRFTAAAADAILALSPVSSTNHSSPAATISVPPSPEMPAGGRDNPIAWMVAWPDDAAAFYRSEPAPIGGVKITALYALPAPAPHAEVREAHGILEDIAAERRRQAGKGYDADHDDEHTDRSIARAAASWALAGQCRSQDGALIYPWKLSTFRPTNARDSLIKAAALCVAEIERLDRALALTQSERGEVARCTCGVEPDHPASHHDHLCPLSRPHGNTP